MVIPYVSSNAFVGDDHQLALYFELRVSVCGFELLASATFYSNSDCNTMFKFRCICDVNFYVIYDGDC
jgi:hypothetical protein